MSINKCLKVCWFIIRWLFLMFVVLNVILALYVVSYAIIQCFIVVD